MSVIGILNQKGGVGKTTTAVNLAACLALSGKKTLLIDADAQGNATSGLSMDRSRFTKTLYDAMSDEIAADAAIYATDIKKLSLLPATPDLAGAEIELVNRPGRETVLRRIITPLTEDFDYILIDCPPSLGLMTVNALSAADSVIIPIQAEFYALEGLAQLVKTVEIVQGNLNPNLSILGILFTMYDGRTNLAKQVVDEVKQYFGARVFKTEIPRSIKLSEAPSFGKPIALYAPNSKGAAAYMKFCREVMRRG